MFVTDVKSTTTTRPTTAASGVVKNHSVCKKFSLGHIDTSSPQAIGGLTPVAIAPVFSNALNDDTPTQKHIKRGYTLLNQLEKIRLDLVAGVIPLRDLRALMETIQARSLTIVDPNLAEIIKEIEIRAAVELAKHDVLFQG